MPSGDGRSRRGLIEPLALTALFLIYSNGLTVWTERRGVIPERVFRRINRPLIGAMLLYGARRGGLGEVGFRREALGRSAVWGVGLGGVLSLPALAFFFRPVLLDTPLEYGPITRLTRRELVKELLLDMPIGIAVLEELAHRGLLYSALRRRFSAGQAIAWSAATFAGWHFAVTATSAAQSNLAGAARLPSFLKPYVQPLAVLGGMLTTGVAGALFGLLRERTGNLAGPIAAHWVVDGIMIYALWQKSSKFKVQSSKFQVQWLKSWHRRADALWQL